MPTDFPAIVGLINTLKSTTASIVNNEALDEEQRTTLVLLAEKRAIAAREPAENVYFIATEVRINTIFPDQSH